MATPDVTYKASLQRATQPGVRTDQRDERHDLPAVTEAQSEAGREWLRKMHFLDTPEHDTTWKAIRRNWISFLSATSDMPDTALAPDRKVVRFFNGKDIGSLKVEEKRRFRLDRRQRLVIQYSFWNNLDGAEALVERWPALARTALNHTGKEQDEKPFETFAAVWDLGRRRRAQAVLSSLVNFLVYAVDQGSIEEMGLKLNESQADDIFDIMQHVSMVTPAETHAKSMVAFSGVWEAVEQLLLRALEKKKSTPRNNPLLWWMAILVRSAISGEDDFISRGRFTGNPIPMDLDLKGRIAAVTHYSKVLVLNSAFASWETSSQGLRKVQDDLNKVDLGWLNGEQGGRPDPAADPRACRELAWQSMLLHLRQRSHLLLGDVKRTAMHRIREVGTALDDASDTMQA